MKELNQPISITITAGTIFKGILIVLLVWFLFVIKDLLLVILTSIVIASAIEPGTRWFVNHRIPRVIGVLLIYVAVILLFGAIFYFFAPTLLQDLNNLLVSVPDYIKSISDKAGNVALSADFINIDSLLANLSSSDLISKISGSFTDATASFINTLSTFFGGLLSFLLIIVLSFYLAVQEDGVASFLKMVIPLKHEKYVLDLWKRSQRKIGLWMQGQLMLAVLIGVLTYLGLSILGIQNALFLAIVAALFELLPVFGPILAAIPAIAFALAQGGLSLGLLVLGLYIIIQQFESQLIHPLVVKKIVGIPAIIAIVALIIGAQMAGFLGMILAVPVASVIMEYLGDVERRKIAESREEESKS